MVPPLNIITPCSRPENLDILKQSIRFDLINKWYIVYDTANRTFTNRYDGDEQIIELETSESCCGAPQRNLGIDKITDGLIYMLDDDNIIHYNFWNLLPMFDEDHVFTFDQIRCTQGGGETFFPGGNPTVCNIDTAQFVVPRKLIGDLRWRIRNCGDGYFMEDMKIRHPDAFVYIPQIGCWWNKINPR